MNTPTKTPAADAPTASGAEMSGADIGAEAPSAAAVEPNAGRPSQPPAADEARSATRVSERETAPTADASRFAAAGQAGAVAVALVVGAALGVWMATPPAGPSPASSAAKRDALAGHSHGAPAPKSASAAAEPAPRWTCSMHPQIKLPKPGRCPICNMDLIPLKPRASDGAPRVEMSKAAAAAARIATTEVKRQAVTVPLRLVGKVRWDETRISRITAWFGGRIERAFVDFTGTRVRKGDHLVSLYSPELYVAQQELIQATKDARSAPAGALGAAARATARASRDKMRLWGLMDFQVKQVLRRGRPQERVTIYAPMGGIVMHKAALEGAWVKTGTPLYTIADLSHVWIELDAYESDLAWLRYNQRARVEVAAFPGEHFDGRIAFVNPTMNGRTRTLKVRLDVANPDLRLKPEMFVRARIDVPVGRSAGPGAESLAGKFVCPMHPGEVADKAGRCSVCGMRLVAAKDHWLVGPALHDGEVSAPLVIPHSAPLFTGKRTVVFVEQVGAQEPTYLVREVKLGPRADKVYIVREGLMAGERVVTQGAFRLDSSMQILGEASVMNHAPGDDSEAAADKGQGAVRRRLLADLRAVAHALEDRRGASLRGAIATLVTSAAKVTGARGLDQAVAGLKLVARDPKAAKRAFADVQRVARLALPEAQKLAPPALPKDPKFAGRLRAALTEVLAVSSALAADKPRVARRSAKRLVAIARTLVAGGRPVHPGLLQGAQGVADKKASVDAQRAAFELVNIALIPLLVLHDDAVQAPYEQVWCPMALDGRGAPWVQPPGEVANPYFGAKMLRCGGKIDRAPPSTSSPAGSATGAPDAGGAAHGHDHGGR